MARLVDLVPDAETLLALPVEVLGGYVLQVARDTMRRPPAANQLCHIQGVISELGVPLGGQGRGYDQARLSEVERAVTEAWAWLEREGYLVPASDWNGRQGWRVLGRKAEGLKDPNAIRAAAKFPKELLHPAIAERAWMPIMCGDFETAVFHAYRTLEEAVRAAGGFKDTDVSVPLMRKAFDAENGPLTDKARPVAEREALSNLFAGAFGSYRNANSHRTGTIRDTAEAQDIVMLASHLLRIVDARRSL